MKASRVVCKFANFIRAMLLKGGTRFKNQGGDVFRIYATARTAAKYQFKKISGRAYLMRMILQKSSPPPYIRVELSLKY